MSMAKSQAIPVVQGSRTQGQLSFSYNPCTLKKNNMGDRNWHNILSSLIARDGTAIKPSTEPVCHKN